MRLRLKWAVLQGAISRDLEVLSPPGGATGQFRDSPALLPHGDIRPGKHRHRTCMIPSTPTGGRA